jgi:hypothetical protein
MPNTELSIDSIIAAGETLVFCDDTYMTQPPQPGYAADIAVLAGLVVPSAKYNDVVPQMTAALKALKVPEFHATEIVNPKSNTPWHQISTEKRIEAFELMRDCVINATTKAFYLFIPKKQYATLRAEAQKQGKVDIAHKQGLKKVFIQALLERLQDATGPVAMILDQDTPLKGYKVERAHGGQFLVGGGPIAVDSATVLGVQLADMYAYCISRYLQKRDKIQQETNSAFDLVAAEVVGQVNLQLLLNLQSRA